MARGPNVSTSGSLCNGSHDYLLKFLLVGDADVGKDEILSGLADLDESRVISSLYTNMGCGFKQTEILLEGRRVLLQLWETSGQGRFSTVFRSYSRGAQGIFIVFDITNRWSFDGVHRWLKEIDEQAPGLPKILLGNRLHLEFKRSVSREEAQHYALKHKMEFFEISSLAHFNIHESLTELSRLVLSRNGMKRLFKPNQALSLQDLCCRVAVQHVRTVYDIDHLPIPISLKFHLKSFADRALLLSGSCTSTIRRTTHNNNNNNSKICHIRSNSDHSKANGGSNNCLARTSSFPTVPAQYGTAGTPVGVCKQQRGFLGRIRQQRRRRTVNEESNVCDVQRKSCIVM